MYAQEETNNKYYAGFFLRASASVIDAIVLGILILTLHQYTELSLLFYLTLPFFYNLFMITSRWQSTIGKLLVGLRVYNVDGTSLTWTQAILRTLISHLSYLLFLPLLTLFFSKKKQTLHDLISKTVVFKYIQWRDLEQGYRSIWSRFNTILSYIASIIFVILFFISMLMITTLFDSVIETDPYTGKIEIHSK